jgi:hypothetical protein
MGTLAAVLPAATTVLLLAVGSGCATKDDVDALRADVASKDDVAALHADAAALRASVEALAARATAPPPPAEYRELRSDIAALQASIRSAGATRGARATATEAVATRGPPGTGR